MAEEVPEQSYYPGARVRLIVRFDDPADPAQKRFNRNPQKLPVTLLKGKTKKVLDIKPDGDVLVLVAPGSSPTEAQPQQMGVSQDLLTQVIEGVIPLRATLGINGIRTANTLQVEILYGDLPLDPRMVRGCGIEFYLGTVTGSEFARGIAGETREAAGGVAEPLNVIPEEYQDGFGRKRTNLRFQGWVDDWETSFSEGIPIIKLTCRDNSTLLIDTQCPPLLTIDAKKPIDRAFAEYLAAFPQFAGLRVAYRPKGAEIPVYATVLQKAAYKPFLGPAAGGGGLSVWDYFTDVAGAIGHIVRFDGATIIIQRSRALYSNRFPTREDDPFQGRQLPTGRLVPFRLFIWGRNLAEMTMKRRFTVAGPTTIEVRCYSTTLKRVLVVRYPLQKDRLERGLPGGLLPDEKIQVFNLQGIKDEKSLRIAAQEIYEQLGRNELEVSLKTQDLGSFGGSALDPDLLDCKAGDTLMLEVAQDEDTASVNDQSYIERQTAALGQAAQTLLNLGYSPDFAKTYAKMVKARALQPIFRVKRLEFSWDTEKGIDIVVQGINYLEVRGDELPAGEEPDFAETAEEAKDRRLRAAGQFGIINLLKGGGLS